MVRFLEREGYDVTYSTNLDTHAHPELIQNHRAFLSTGHDEYWLWEMRDNVEAARNAGVNLGFFGSNAAYWQIRLEASGLEPNRTVVCYKYAQPESPDGINDNVPTNDPIGHQPGNSAVERCARKSF